MDPINITVNPVTIGAAYGALQAVAQLLLLVLPKKTVAWRLAKFILGGPAAE